MGDFNVHYIECLDSNTTDVGGREALDFSISHELEHIIQHLTCVLDCHGNKANILDLFFIFNPQNYTYATHPPLGSLNHILVSVPCSFAHPLPYAPHPSSSLALDDTQYTELRSYFLYFPWEDCCFHLGDLWWLQLSLMSFVSTF